MKDFVYYNYLFDIYCELLTENEIVTFKDYYQEDLSLAEIADEKNVSRSAIQKTVKNVLDKLNLYESKLHVYANNSKLYEALNMDNIDEIKAKIREVLGN